jgi:hypothetical protein
MRSLLLFSWIGRQICLQPGGERLEAVLPATASSVEWPQLQQPIASPPVLVFRRNDSSLFSHNIIVQWSSDLMQWTDIEVPYESSGAVSITPNDSDPDLIQVTLPSPAGPNPKIFVRLAVSENEFAR